MVDPGSERPAAASPASNGIDAGKENVPVAAGDEPSKDRMKLQCELAGHENAVACVKFSESGTMLASCGADKSVRVWDIGSAKAEAKMKFEGHTAGVNDVSWDPTSKFLVSASDDKTLIIWSIDSKEKTNVLEGHTTYVFCCCFNPQGSIIASGSFDETIRLWSTRDGKCLRELPAHSDPVTSVDFNRDGTMLVSSSHDGLCRIWDVSNGHCLKTLIDESSPPVAFATFSPNGKYILVGALDSAIRLWSYLDESKIMKTYRGHANEKYCLISTFLIREADGTKRVASGSEDGDIVIWDLNSKKVVQRISGRRGETSTPADGHSGAVLAVSADKNFRLATAGFDKTIKIWSVV